MLAFLLFARLYLCNASLGLDEAEQIVFAQTLSAGYPSQPPLYTWLQYAVFYCFGVNLFSLALLKYSLLLAAVVVYYRLCHLLCKPLFAWLAFFSWALIPNISYDLLMHRTHVILALFATCLSWYWLLANIPNQHSNASNVLTKMSKGLQYIVFGLILGIGILSKFNYLLFLCLLIASALSVPLYRKKLCDPFLLLSVLVVLLMVTPYCRWLLQNPKLGFYSAYKLIPPGKTIGDGLISLCMAACCFMLPSVLLLIIFFKDIFSKPFLKNRTLKAARQNKADPIIHTTDRDETESLPLSGLLLRYHLLLFPSLVCLILATGMHEVKSHWLLPLLCCFPLCILSCLSSKFSESQIALATRSAHAYRYGCIFFQIFFCALWISRTPFVAKWPLDDFLDAVKKEQGSMQTIVSDSHWLLGSLMYRLSVPKGILLLPWRPTFLPTEKTLFAWEGAEMPAHMNDTVTHRESKIEVSNKIKVLGGCIVAYSNTY